MTKLYLWYAWSITEHRYLPIGVSEKHRGMFPSGIFFGLPECNLISIPFFPKHSSFYILPF